MDIKHIGINIFVVSICSFIVYIPHACYAEQYIEVTSACIEIKEYNINYTEDIILLFQPWNVDSDGFSSFPSCVLTFVNHDDEQSICIKTLKETSKAAMDWCDFGFKYYTGFLPKPYEFEYPVYNVCSNFDTYPLCTPKSQVFTVFSGVSPPSSIPKIAFKLFTNYKYGDPRHRSTTEDYTREYYSGEDENVLGLVVTVIAGSFVVFALCFIVCKCVVCTTAGTTDVINVCTRPPLPTSQDNEQELQSLAQPWPTPQTNSPCVQSLQRQWEGTHINTNSQDILPYSSDMDGQSLYSYNEVENAQIHYDESRIACPNAVFVPSLYENSNIPIEQVRTIDLEEHDISTEPPLDYLDLPPPPSYPGTYI